MIYKVSFGFVIKMLFIIIILICLFPFALDSLIAFFITLYQTGNTWNIFNLNNLFTLFIYGTATIASPIIIIISIVVLFHSRKFKINISDGKFDYYSNEKYHYKFQINEMVIRYEIQRVHKRPYISDIILYVCEKNNDSSEVALHCGLIGLKKFHEMVHFITSHGAMVNDNKDTIQENISVGLDSISTKNEVIIKQINHEDTIIKDKEIWVCGRCKTENSFELDNCKNCQKEFNPPL
jgi:phage pi2 protein 07